jgi:hypothetical protein
VLMGGIDCEKAMELARGNMDEKSRPLNDASIRSAILSYLHNRYEDFVHCSKS